MTRILNCEIKVFLQRVNADLKSTIINLFNSTDININTSNIEICHSIDTKKRNIVIRYVNGRPWLSVLINRKVV